jgi:ribonuclease HI
VHKKYSRVRSRIAQAPQATGHGGPNSKVIAGQIKKECIARDNTLEKYLALIQRMEKYFRTFLVEHIDRSRNTEVDELVKAAARKAALPHDIFF